ncbi:DNA binding domain-containing protein, excisionase family [Paraburkholderia phenazinium]|uniref:DNA binding domain-containing protein, excisionase family n=1 Tax=Paraburkholderia phenazinium TaxID=60549 RepID=A0A1G7YFN0_9BURK|nr:helix-turn-helix domain-containing protein [Paraburkholderia phenazinium]SDG95382.1 DNA binding domain-containing protein, excisionase family [Paraburkholderia phenazinium]
MTTVLSDEHSQKTALAPPRIEPDASMRRLLSIREAAERLGCTTYNVVYLRRVGRITGMVVNHRVRFDPDELERAVRERNAWKEAACKKRPRKEAGSKKTPRDEAPEKKSSLLADGLLSSQEAAQLLGTSRAYLQHFINKGLLRGTKQGHRWTFTREVVDALLKRRAAMPTGHLMYRLQQAQAQRRAKIKQAMQARLDAEAPRPAFVLSTAMRNWPILDERDRLRGTRY